MAGFSDSIKLSYDQDDTSKLSGGKFFLFLQKFLPLIFAMSLMSLSRTDCFTAIARGYCATRNGKVEQLILLSGLHGELLYHADTTHDTPDERILGRYRDHLQSLTSRSGRAPRNPNPRLGGETQPCRGRPLLQFAAEGPALHQGPPL